jgi:hypothetical protein
MTIQVFVPHVMVAKIKELPTEVLVHRLNTDRLVHLWMLKAMCGAKLTA